MSVAKELREFTSIKEFQEALAEELARVRNLLGASLDALRSMQKRAGPGPGGASSRRLQLGALEVTLNAGAKEERDLLEWVVGTLLTKQKGLQQLRKDLEGLLALDEAMTARVQVVFGDGTPTHVLLRMPREG